MRKFRWIACAGFAAVVWVSGGNASAQGLGLGGGGAARGGLGGGLGGAGVGGGSAFGGSMGGSAMGAGGARGGLGSVGGSAFGASGMGASTGFSGRSGGAAGLGLGGSGASGGIGAGAGVSTGARSGGLFGTNVNAGAGVNASAQGTAGAGARGLFTRDRVQGRVQSSGEATGAGEFGAGVQTGMHGSQSSGLTGHQRAAAQADLFLSQRLAEIDVLRDQAIAEGNAALLTRADALEAQIREQHAARVQHLQEVDARTPDPRAWGHVDAAAQGSVEGVATASGQPVDDSFTAGAAGQLEGNFSGEASPVGDWNAAGNAETTAAADGGLFGQTGGFGSFRAVDADVRGVGYESSEFGRNTAEQAGGAVNGRFSGAGQFEAQSAPSVDGFGAAQGAAAAGFEAASSGMGRVNGYGDAAFEAQSNVYNYEGAGSAGVQTAGAVEAAVHSNDWNQQRPIEQGSLFEQSGAAAEVGSEFYNGASAPTAPSPAMEAPTPGGRRGNLSFLSDTRARTNAGMNAGSPEAAPEAAVSQFGGAQFESVPAATQAREQTSARFGTSPWGAAEAAPSRGGFGAWGEGEASAQQSGGFRGREFGAATSAAASQSGGMPNERAAFGQSTAAQAGAGFGGNAPRGENPFGEIPGGGFRAQQSSAFSADAFNR